ncbi:CvpA family protein [Ruminococcus champanellensis]|uniref:CvpA family protein n=1 Tax=Ruminococcus champanellensis TaxID=1161942 RepID=UPI0039F45427
MGSQFWWFYDILAVALTLFIIYLNAKRGFKKNFLIIIGYVLSVVVTSVTSAMLAEPVYTGLIRESNLYAFDQVLSDYDGTAVIQNALDKQEYGAKFDEKKIDIYLSPAKADFEDELYRYVNQTCDYTVTTPTEFRNILRGAFIESFGSLMAKQMPLYARLSLEDKLADNDTLYVETMQHIYGETGSMRQITAYLEDTYVKDDCIRIINSFLFVAIFCCLMSLIAVLAKKLESRIYFNIYPVVDHIAGGLLGILEALMLLCLLCIFLRLLFVTASDTMLVLNEETILKSRLFRYIYQLSGKL